MQATVTSTEFLYMMAHHPSLTIAVRDVRRMKEFLADHLNLPRHVFWFCGSRVGSLITVWQFSGSYSKELQRFLDNTSALQWSTLQYHQSAFRVVLTPSLVWRCALLRSHHLLILWIVRYLPPQWHHHAVVREPTIDWANIVLCNKLVSTSFF